MAYVAQASFQVGEKLLLARGGVIFLLSDLPSCLVLVFWNLSEAVEERVLIKAVGYVQFILCTLGYIFLS